MLRPPPKHTLFPYTTLFRSSSDGTDSFSCSSTYMNSSASKRTTPSRAQPNRSWAWMFERVRSEEHTSELQSRLHLVCRLLLEKKKKTSDRLHVRCKIDDNTP